MNLDLDTDTAAVLAALEGLLADAYPLGRPHEREELAPLADFGLPALTLPEAAGGAGLSLVQAALAHVRLGRHLVSPALAAAAVAAAGLHRLGEPAPVAVAPALRDGAGLMLLDQPQAGWALVGAEGALVRLDGPAPVAVPAAGHGGGLWRVPGGAARVLPGAADHWRLLIAAQLLGLAEGALELALAHARTREQFGRPIGSFQAIKHRCADMAIEAGLVSAQLDFAALALRDGWPDAGFQLAALVRLAPGVALANARACIQIHGALGFSAEALPHRFLKQAHQLALLLGPTEMLAHPAPLAPFGDPS
jgi:alkylation response protein AidB-like acyl-CoA dehydrogenase